jgi:leader peptidase (prepilin peptidase)/N-methyltransferase
LSWGILGGKCRYCRINIPIIHPAVEIMAAALAIQAILSVSGWLVWPTVVLGWSLLTLALMDCYYLVLADAITIPLCLIGIAVSFALSPEIGKASLIGAIGAGLSALTIRGLYRALRGRDGLGLGDVKLIAAAGAWVSWEGLPSVVLIASAGAILIIGLLSGLRGGNLAQRRVPFGAFIAIGLWIVWLYGPIQVGF